MPNHQREEENRIEEKEVKEKKRIKIYKPYANYKFDKSRNQRTISTEQESPVPTPPKRRAAVTKQLSKKRIRSTTSSNPALEPVVLSQSSETVRPSTIDETTSRQIQALAHQQQFDGTHRSTIDDTIIFQNIQKGEEWLALQSIMKKQAEDRIEISAKIRQQLDLQQLEKNLSNNLFQSPFNTGEPDFLTTSEQPPHSTPGVAETFEIPIPDQVNSTPASLFAFGVPQEETSEEWVNRNFGKVFYSTRPSYLNFLSSAEYSDNGSLKDDLGKNTPGVKK